MKIAESMKIIDQKWVKKRKGFRVQFKRYTGTDWVEDMSPPEDAPALDSDVTTWRLAWKLSESTPLTNDEVQAGDMADIRVVDQNNDPIENYATGAKDVFNRIVT